MVCDPKTTGGDNSVVNTFSKPDADLIAVAPELLTVAELGQKMRAAQRAYFRNRTQENLIASKVAEKAFDDALKAALSKVQS